MKSKTKVLLAYGAGVITAPFVFAGLRAIAKAGVKRYLHKPEIMKFDHSYIPPQLNNKFTSGGTVNKAEIEFKPVNGKVLVTTQYLMKVSNYERLKVEVYKTEGAVLGPDKNGFATVNVVNMMSKEQAAKLSSDINAEVKKHGEEVKKENI